MVQVWAARHLSFGRRLILGMALLAALSQMVGPLTLNAGTVYLVRDLVGGEPGAAARAAALLETAGERYQLAGAYRNLAALALQRQQPQAAEQPARRAVELQPADRLARYWLGLAYWQQGNKAAARTTWRASGYTAQRLAYLDWLTWHQAGLGDPAGAVATVQAAIDLDPMSGPAYDTLASLAWGQDWTTVAWALDDAITYLPEDSAGWYWNLGRRYVLHGDWSNAARALRRSVDRQPAEWPMRFLATALARSGQADEAARVESEIAARWGK